MILLYLVAWLPMMLLGVGNGFLREATYGKVLPELRAHQLSTLTGTLLIGCYVAILTRLWPLASTRQALAVGGLWLVMTVAFELVFGRLVAGHSWRRLLLDYDLLSGRLWALFLLFVALAPWLFTRMWELILMTR